MRIFLFKKPLRYILAVPLCNVIFCILLMAAFSGKSHIALESIAVSPNERYIACFENGNGYKIRCFHADTSLAFDYNIPSEISAGGHCTLWFEGDVLYVSFYRTDKIVCLSMDGTVIQIIDNCLEDDPPEFPSFYKKRHQLIYDGAEIDVVYNYRGFLGYYFLGQERYLAVISASGETKNVYTWTAKQ